MGNAALAVSVKEVGTVMERARDPWWIIASAAIALHGVDPGGVSDVDVLLSVGDAERILPALGLKLQPGSAHEMFRSAIFATWRGTILPVEFMAGFERRSGADWLPVQPLTRVAIDSGGGVTVFVPALAELSEMLASFGRPKDLERAKRLAAHGAGATSKRTQGL